MVPPRAPRHAACPLSSRAVLPPFAEHQSSLTTLLEMRFMVMLASPTQATLPWHLPSEATLSNSPLMLMVWSHLTYINIPSP